MAGMITLQSYVRDRWHEAHSGFSDLVDPCSEEPIARVSSAGIDFDAALRHARETGGPALRAMSIAERGAMLLELSKALHAQRDALNDLSLESTGTTRRDAKFDVDGGIFTLSHYGHWGRDHAGPLFLDGEGAQLGRSPRFWGRHVQVPLRGAAVFVNAFNFPVWGVAEKAACAWLAGMPVLVKPATSTALLAERAVRAMLDAGVLPKGALSLICGSTGDLLERLGEQDVLAFTGSASTARKLRGLSNLLDSSTRVNVEADSLNAAVLGPDVEPGSDVWDLFVRDVTREIVQKTGQKCTAVRRILVPRARADEAQAALIEALGDTVTGNPREGSVTMGPLATRDQLADAEAGTAKLAAEAKIVHGTGKRVDGAGNPAGKGWFFGPTLLRTDAPEKAVELHRTEVFAPVSTVMAWDGGAAAAADLVARARGTLVTSLYSDDRDFVATFLAEGGAATGRLYVGSSKVAAQMPGSGVAMPQMQHGGPGRAGGGAELGGPVGLGLYLQRVALMGDRALLERLAAEQTAEA